MSPTEACLHRALCPTSSGGWSTSRLTEAQLPEGGVSDTLLLGCIHCWVPTQTCTRDYQGGKPGQADHAGTPCYQTWRIYQTSTSFLLLFPCSSMWRPDRFHRFLCGSELKKRKGESEGKEDKQGCPFICVQTKPKQQLLLFDVKGFLLSLILGQWTHHLHCDVFTVCHSCAESCGLCKRWCFPCHRCQSQESQLRGKNWFHLIHTQLFGWSTQLSSSSSQSLLKWSTPAWFLVWDQQLKV